MLLAGFTELAVAATYIVAVPCNHIKRTVVLGAEEELPIQLIYNFPFFLLNLVLGFWVKEVTSIRKTVGTERAQFGQFEVCSPDLEDVSTGWSIRKVDTESLAALNDYYLARLHKEWTKLSLDVQAPLLRDDQEVSVRVDEGSLVHIFVGSVDMGGYTLSEGGITRASNCLKSGDEVDICSTGNVEG